VTQHIGVQMVADGIGIPQIVVEQPLHPIRGQITGLFGDCAAAVLVRMPAPRSGFAGFRFPPEVIIVAVRWCLCYGLSYRDVEESDEGAWYIAPPAITEYTRAWSREREGWTPSVSTGESAVLRVLRLNLHRSVPAGDRWHPKPGRPRPEDGRHVAEATRSHHRNDRGSLGGRT
jgi:hypothetical protein